MPGVGGNADSLLNFTYPSDSGQTIEVGLNTDTGYHGKSEATSADVVVCSTVEVEVDFGAGPRQASASPDSSTVLGPALDVTVVE